MIAKNITQIIGLPRSRTAWLSVALTHGDCFAFHDASNPPGSCGMDEYMRRLANCQQKNVVDCSSALLVHHDLVLAADCPIIIIERDADDARDSFANHIRNAGLVQTAWPLIERGFNELRRRFSSRIVAHVEFDELANSGVIQSIFTTVAPGQSFDFDGCEKLQKLNIQERKPSWAGD